MADPKTFKVSVKVSIAAEGEEHEGVLSKGTAALLKGIKEQGSLNKIAHSIHMAYSKAWRILKETEERLGIPLVIRDGARGSTLTPEGEKLLAVYETVVAETEEFAQKRYLEELAKTK